VEAANTAEVAVLPSALAESKVFLEPTIDVEVDETECLGSMSRLSYHILKYESTEIYKYSRNKKLKLFGNGKQIAHLKKLKRGDNKRYQIRGPKKACKSQ